MTRLQLGVLMLACAMLWVGCVPTSYGYTRGSDDPSVDDPALSHGIDRRDVDDVLDQNLDDLLSSRFMTEVARGKAGPRATVAILPFVNTTMQDIDGALDGLLGRVETIFVNDGRMDVVATYRRDELRAERFEQQDFVIFDASRAVSLGRELGAHYVITGEVYEVDEMVADMERVQYFMKLQVLNVETGKIEWQGDGEVTKALVPVASLHHP